MRTTVRTLVVLGALVAAGAVQGCAVTTGRFVPSQAERTNNSMVSYFSPFGPKHFEATPHHTMTTTHEKGFQDYRYY